MASENSDKMTSELHTTRRILLRVAYDGTNYHGWQVQPNAKTIEGELNRVLTQLTGEEIQVTGASRTDAGVHALGNVAVFDTVSKIPAEKFSYALNQRLPEDIVIQSSLQVADDFHPRHCDCRKTYEYDILNRTFPLPAYRNTAYFLYGDLDLDAMRKACQAFLGEHDFASFCAAGAQVQTTVRTIYSLEVLEQPLAVTGRGSKPASEVTGADRNCSCRAVTTVTGTPYDHPCPGKRFSLQYGADHCRNLGGGWQRPYPAGGGRGDHCCL